MQGSPPPAPPSYLRGWDCLPASPGSALACRIPAFNQPEPPRGSLPARLTGRRLLGFSGSAVSAEASWPSLGGGSPLPPPPPTQAARQRRASEAALGGGGIPAESKEARLIHREDAAGALKAAGAAQEASLTRGGGDPGFPRAATPAAECA